MNIKSLVLGFLKRIVVGSYDVKAIARATCVASLSTIAGLRRLARARGISQMQHGFETRHRRGVSVLHSPVMKTETAVEAMAAGDVKTMAFKEMTDAQTALLDGKCAPLRYISPWPCMSA